ncbi:hypothetical protein ARMGADRAFT_1025199 [Armillaria gallica]|uniref:Uncharacterized protein n=1 Tax=Armillaria gallica TaxID=47427 RepID=A0A2H3EEP4_ARMGA|nr:hypothetical protein ARMGADRAFT_1025199 [Armillaria gallica]
MLVGPIGESGGAVEVQSIHSGMAMGLQWPEVDKKGFSKVEKSFLYFGLKSFSKEERNARVLKGTTIDKEDDILAPVASLPPLQMVKTAPISDISDRSPLPSLPSKVLESSITKSPCPLSNKTVEPSTDHPHPMRFSSLPPGFGSLWAVSKGGSSQRAGEELNTNPMQDEWYPELVTAFDGFRRGALWDPLWSRAADGFLVFERQQGFATKGKALCARDQPACVHAFMKEHCRWGRPRDLGDLKEFNKQWWAWWGALQPAG